MTDFICKFYVEPSKYTSGTNVETTIEDFGKNREKNRKKYFVQVDKEVQSTIAGLVKFMALSSKK